MVAARQALRYAEGAVPLVRAIEIRPSCTPIDRIPSFVHARRRDYLTATLADDSALVTDFGADPTLVVRPITSGSAVGLGDRMILAPVALNPNLDADAVRVLARQFADGDRDGDGVVETEPVNVVVLVPATGPLRPGSPTPTAPSGSVTSRPE
ncbi:hypothetical protein ACFYUG_32745 [Streptomyces albogriseolus]|uniref:hypothetical protein n=1 Tax=Streptomyces albogriseolus TaxID=1887 RepID=UPI00369CE598